MGSNQKRFRWRAMSLVLVLVTLMLGSLTGALAQTTLSCSATYSITGQWPGAFQGRVIVANSGTSAITGWTVTWTFANGQTIYQLWGGPYTQTGSAVSVRNETWNGNLAAGGTAEVGFLANVSGTNNVPTNVACTPNGGTTATNTPTRTPTLGPSSTPTRTPTTGPTNTPTRTPTTGPTNTPTRTPTPPPVGTHLDNPFVGATFYRNVDYVASVNAAADLTGGTLGARMRQVANFPTFVWLDSIDAVNGTNGYPRSLAGHLDAALAQGANAIGLVIYDLPNRDCSALASNGEPLIAQNGLNRYKAEYIDVIFNAIRQAKYSNLRIAMIIEPDSLPNLITNLSFAKCAEANSTGAYVQGVQYAIGTLRSKDCGDSCL